MGNEGRWTSFVGSLDSLTHVQRAHGGAADMGQVPGPDLVSPKTASFNDANRATSWPGRSCA